MATFGHLINCFNAACAASTSTMANPGTAYVSRVTDDGQCWVLLFRIPSCATLSSRKLLLRVTHWSFASRILPGIAVLTIDYMGMNALHVGLQNGIRTVVRQLEGRDPKVRAGLCHSSRKSANIITQRLLFSVWVLLPMVRWRRAPSSQARRSRGLWYVPCAACCPCSRLAACAAGDLSSAFRRS